MEPFAVRVEEAARLLGIKRSKMFEMISAGEIKSYTVGRARRVPIAALRQWVATQCDMHVADLAGAHPNNPGNTSPDNKGAVR